MRSQIRPSKINIPPRSLEGPTQSAPAYDAGFPLSAGMTASPTTTYVVVGDGASSLTIRLSSCCVLLYVDSFLYSSPLNCDAPTSKGQGECGDTTSPIRCVWGGSETRGRPPTQANQRKKRAPRTLLIAHTKTLPTKAVDTIATNCSHQRASSHIQDHHARTW